MSYVRDGEEYLLVSNARHPLMKLACKDVDRKGPLTQPDEPVGAPRHELPHQGVGRMANLNGSHVLMIREDDAGNIHLRSYDTSTLGPQDVDSICHGPSTRGAAAFVFADGPGLITRVGSAHRVGSIEVWTIQLQGAPKHIPGRREQCANPSVKGIQRATT